jgi:hypothetical protein
MINFFRKIRRNLLSERNTTEPALLAGRYIKYAIGEILLVVIGILLALQINTWSQMHKDSKEELVILEKLQANIKTDSTNLKYWLFNIQSTLDNLAIIEMEIKDQQLKRFSVDLYDPLLSVFSMDLETTTWQNLKSTGKISLIKNSFLMDSLQSYYTQFDIVNKSWQEGFKSYNRNILAPKFFEFDDLTFFGPTSNTLQDDVQLLQPYKYGQEVFFRNAIRFRIGATQSIQKVFKDDFERAINMLEMLKAEIESKTKPN